MSNHSTNWPHPNEWLPSTVRNAARQTASGDIPIIWKIFPAHSSAGLNAGAANQSYKGTIAGQLLEKMQVNGDDWGFGAKKETIIPASVRGGPAVHALNEMIADGYVHQADGKLYITDKLKTAFVDKAYEHATGVPYSSIAEAAVKNAAGATKEVEAVAKSGRAWYKFATHSLKENEAVFSTPRTLVSGAVLLGTGLVAHHYMKASNDDSWQQHIQAQVAGGSEPQR